MAKCKKCTEEFNPWPSFVDLFSSVILVLIFFILFIIVLLAYFLQFNSKDKGGEKIEVIAEQKGVPVKAETISKTPQIPKPKPETETISGDKEKKIKVGLHIAATKKTKKKIKKKPIEGEDFILITFDRGEKILNSEKYPIIGNFIKEKRPVKVIIEMSIPKLKNRQILNKKMSLVRGININSYVEKLKKEITTLREVDFKIKRTIEEGKTLSKEQLKNGFVKILINGD